MSLFDFNDLPEQENPFSPLPDGLYPVVVEKAEWRVSKNNEQNEYLNLQFRVTGENYANRVIFNMLNLINANEIARNIAMHDMKKLLIASGVDLEKTQLASKEDILSAVINKAVLVKLATKKDYQGEDKNVIKGYEEITSGVSSDDIPF